VRIIDFSRNFGHQAAIFAGIENANCDAAIIIDGDLQDPPELIPQMIKKWEEGFEVVYGKRIKREGESMFKRLTAFIFYRFINMLSDIEIPKDVGDFRLIDKKVINVLKKQKEKNIFIRGLISWIGFKQTFVEYERDKRYAGNTKYPLIKMLNFAFDGITSFSTKPLRMSMLLGLICIIISIGLIIYTLIMKYAYPDMVITGWTSLFIAVIFFGGIQLFTIGVVGEYIGKVYRETKNRPLYIIREKIGFNDTEDKESVE
jgi:dolichol-phosphate mannosyltransferase